MQEGVGQASGSHTKETFSKSQSICSTRHHHDSLMVQVIYYYYYYLSGPVNSRANSGQATRPHVLVLQILQSMVILALAGSPAKGRLMVQVI